MGAERGGTRSKLSIPGLVARLRTRGRAVEQPVNAPFSTPPVEIRGAQFAVRGEPARRDTLPSANPAFLSPESGEQGDRLQPAIQYVSRKVDSSQGQQPSLAGRLVREHISKRAQWLANHDPNKPSFGRALTGIAEFMPIPIGGAITAVAPEIGVPLYATLAAIPGIGWILAAALTAYTVGDLVTGFELIRGKTLDGRPLSILEKGIYAIATAIPGLPARPFITWLDKQQEKHLDPRIKAAQQNTPGK